MKIGIVYVMLVTVAMLLASYYLMIFFLEMMCSRIRTSNAPMTKPLPMIGRNEMGNRCRNDLGRNATIVPVNTGIPITKIFSRDKSSLERKTIFLPAAI